MVTLVLVGEDRCHWETVSVWTDTLLVHWVDYLRGQDLDAFRQWSVDDGARRLGLPYLTLSRARTFGSGRRSHGRFDGRPGAPDARATVDRLLMAQAATPPADLVVVCRDVDQQPARREGFEQGRRSRTWPFTVVLALATPEMEAWRIVTWRPHTDAERKRLECARTEFEFDPLQEPNLMSSSPAAKRETKSILAVLAIGDAWKQVDAERLERAVVGVGLSEFVADLRSGLVPRFLPTERTPPGGS